MSKDDGRLIYFDSVKGGDSPLGCQSQSHRNRPRGTRPLRQNRHRQNRLTHLRWRHPGPRRAVWPGFGGRLPSHDGAAYILWFYRYRYC